LNHKTIFGLSVCLMIAGSSAAFAASGTNTLSDPLFPDGKTLYIDRSIKPDPLRQEVDPSYAFHAKSARLRLKRSLYFLLQSRQELKLYQNHMRTLELTPSEGINALMVKLILALDDTLNPPRDVNPLSNVITNLPSVAISVDPQSRAIITSEPSRAFDELSNMYDHLAAPAQRYNGNYKDPEAISPAPLVGSSVPAIREASKAISRTAQKKFKKPSFVISPDSALTQALPHGGSSEPFIPSYQPHATSASGETCSTCTDTGPTVIAR